MHSVLLSKSYLYLAEAKSADAVLPNAAAGASAPMLPFESPASAGLSNFNPSEILKIIIPAGTGAVPPSVRLWYHKTAPLIQRQTRLAVRITQILLVIGYLNYTKLVGFGKTILREIDKKSMKSEQAGTISNPPESPQPPEIQGGAEENKSNPHNTPKAIARRKRREEKKMREAAAAEEAQRQQRTKDEKFMKKALDQAGKAASIGEVPIGCVIVKDGKILSRGYNRRCHDHSALSHAEVSAIRKACRKLSDWRLEGCTLYVTLEPCPMCAGACVQSRIDRVVIGASSPKSGCGGTLLNILQNGNFTHRCAVTEGILAKDCSAVLSDYFRNIRRESSEKKMLPKS